MNIYALLVIVVALLSLGVATLGFIYAIRARPTIASYLPTIFLAIGGIAAICFGAFLYYVGVGVQVDGAFIKYDKFDIALKTVGSVMMGTSLIWAYWSFRATPDPRRTAAEEIRAAITDAIENSESFQGMKVSSDTVGMLGRSDVQDTDLGGSLNSSLGALAGRVKYKSVHLSSGFFGGGQQQIRIGNFGPRKVAADPECRVLITYNKEDRSKFLVLQGEELLFELSEDNGIAYSTVREILSRLPAAA